MNKALHASSLQFVDRELEDIFEGIKNGKIDSSRFLSLSKARSDDGYSTIYSGTMTNRRKKYKKIEGHFEFSNIIDY